MTAAVDNAKLVHAPQLDLIEDIRPESKRRRSNGRNELLRIRSNSKIRRVEFNQLA